MILSDNETKVDLLNNEAIAKTIVSLIRDSKDQPISIGIHGDWGAGKSSILEMVENEVNGSNSESGKKYSCIRFNGWRHQGFEDSKIALMSSIVSELEKRLKQTVMHKDLGRQVSYQYLLRLESYKLIKHLIGEKEYEGFRIWW